MSNHENLKDETMHGKPVTQPWTHDLTFMQQTVLLTAVRGPDGLPKYHPAKFILRWFRRCTLLSSLDGGRVLKTPYDPVGGSFMGPSVAPPVWDNLDHGDSGYRQYTASPDGSWSDAMGARASDYLRSLDEVPHHFQLHLMHAAEIVGYKHPDSIIRLWWCEFYVRLAHDMHLFPESEAQLDARLGDTREGWLARADSATVE